MRYVFDIRVSFILGVNLLKQKLDFKNNEIHSRSEVVALLKIKNPEIVHQVIGATEIVIPPKTNTLIKIIFSAWALLNIHTIIIA